MVYYDPPKHKPDASSGSARFSSLPKELLQSIIAFVDNQTVTSLRITNSNFTGICNDALAKRLKVLYIHSTPPSLRQAVEICGHRIFRERIEEIVLLGKVFWKDLEKTMPQIRSPACGHHINAAAVKGKFCPWPARPYANKIDSSKIETTTADGFAVDYTLLLSAVAPLPKLRALSFLDGVREPGWNQTSQESIVNHAKACYMSPRTNAQYMRRADVNALFNLLSALDQGITSLRLDTELPFASGVADELRGLCGRPPASASFHRLAHICNLTSLDLVIDIGIGNDEHALERGLIACAAPALQHLKLTLVPQHARAQAAVPYENLMLLSLSGMLSYGGDETTSLSTDCYFQRLESLTLEYRDPPVPAKCKNERRRVRPTCQFLDLSTLLDRVRHTIRHISITNIIFPPEEYGFIANNLKDTNLKVHSAIIADDGNAFRNLEQFKWCINRYNHDPRCRSQSKRETHGDCDKYLCGWYLPECTLEMFETTAETLGAELITLDGDVDGEFGYWDFGAAIMRAREAALLSRQRVRV